MKLANILTIALLWSSCTALVSADVDKGKELHDESCLDCHMIGDHTELYTRKNRQVDSLPRLGGQVSRCTQILNITWFPEEEKDVVDYLNSQYYHFKE